MADEENKYLQELFPDETGAREIVRKFRSYIASPFIAAEFWWLLLFGRGRSAASWRLSAASFI